MSDKLIQASAITSKPSPVREVKPVASSKTGKPKKGSFDEILASKMETHAGVKFSSHAQKRLESRGIKLNEAELAGIRNAVEMASRKGSRESLFLLNDLALIVSIKNRTVITAVDGESRKENVFTNIDSAVIV